MNGFWVSELGEITGNADDAFAKVIKQIPDGTCAIARIESFKNMNFLGSEYLNINWVITSKDFNGQKVSQKLKVFSAEPKTRHRALNMLKLIYQLFNVIPSHKGSPKDEDLSVFVGKSAGIRIQETEPNDNGKQYNWVSQVAFEKDYEVKIGTPLVVSTNRQSVNGKTRGNPSFEALHLEKDLNDDIPFF